MLNYGFKLRCTFSPISLMLAIFFPKMYLTVKRDSHTSRAAPHMLLRQQHAFPGILQLPGIHSRL